MRKRAAIYFGRRITRILEKGKWQIFFWYERGKFPFGKTKIEKKKKIWEVLENKRFFFKKGTGRRMKRREKENKAVVVPPEKGGMKKEGKQRERNLRRIEKE